MLKLAALDEKDLEVVSAHVQDAVLKVGELAYHPDARQFTAAMNRFAWEVPRGFFGGRDERRRSLLQFDRVLGAKLSGIDRSRPENVLSLLAIRFQASDAPAGTVDLLFSGGGTVRLDVECIEARLTDLGAAWRAGARPAHGA